MGETLGLVCQSSSLMRTAPCRVTEQMLEEQKQLIKIIILLVSNKRFNSVFGKLKDVGIEKLITRVTIRESNQKTICAERQLIRKQYFSSTDVVNCFVFYQGWKSKADKEAFARSWLVKQVFLQYKVTNCTMSQDTCTLFARIYTLLCAVGQR